MNVSAINYTPIKPQVSFKGKTACERVEAAPAKASEIAASSKFDAKVKSDLENDDVLEFSKNIVESGDIKSPANIAIAVAGAIAGIYGAAKGGAAFITKVSKGKAPIALENGLKKGSKIVQDKAEKLTSTVTPGKIGKAKQFAGKTLKKGEELAKGAYKAVAYSSIDPKVGNPERAKQAFKNAAGAGAVAAAVPVILTNDTNDDGVKDIVQRSQNAYLGTKSQVENLSALAELVTALT